MTLSPRDVVYDDPVFLSTLSKRSLGWSFHGLRGSAPVSGSYASGGRVHYYPFYTSKPYSLARWFWLNGATVGTNYAQAGIYDQDLNLLQASPRTLSAGTVNEIQYANPGVHATSVNTNSSSSDLDAYDIGSQTLKAGVLYLLCVENSHASNAPTISSVDNGPTFVSRVSVQFNGNLNRVSIWSCVPAVDFTGTLSVNFGASSGVTGASLAMIAFYGVDTTTNDGIVQNATGTGTSTTPLATLGAFGSAANASFGAFGQAANSTGAVESNLWVELSDQGTSTPAQALQTNFRPDNDTTVSETITSAAWGACAVEIKALASPIVVPPMRGYLAIMGTGSTMTLYRTASVVYNVPHIYIQTLSSIANGLLPLATLSTASAGALIYVFGITHRASP